jgi:rRNA maturation protein Nop10
VPVVGEEETRGGGDAAPRSANHAASKDVLGRKADKDLPHEDLLRECGDGGGDTASVRPRRHSWRSWFDRCRVAEKEGCDEGRAPPRPIGPQRH